MRFFRWVITFLLVFAASILALILLALLLVAIGVLQFARLAQWIRPPVPQPARNAPSAAAAPADRGGDSDLPEAPAGVDLQHVRSWDSVSGRAVERWYYKDARGQWVFVRTPRSV